nr:Tn3 family transposase [Bathymodiolus platifrons methanotrophic gill symbiont]
MPLLQENTQSTIVRKLNSYARYTGLKKALIEYNSIFKSTHVLNLIDNMALRKAIRTARNRTEAYHQLQGLIRKIYRGIFKGKKYNPPANPDKKSKQSYSKLVTICKKLEY